MALGVVAAAGCVLGGAAVFSSSSKAAETTTCPAAHVHGNWVYAGPFKGRIDTQYDVSGGRFRLRVGRYRNRATGLTQKIPWFLPPRFPAGHSLVIRGTRRTPTRRQFTQRFGDPANVFPTIIAPPAPGCWRLIFRAGRTTGRLTVWVHGSGRGS